MVKKTEDQLFDHWQSKISKRQSFRESLHEYQELIQKLFSGEDATDKLKAFVKNYGPINPLLIPLEEFELLGEASIGTGFPVFANNWIAKPIECAWKSPVIREGGRGGRDKMNWDVYLDDKRFVRFAVRQNTPRQIKEALKSWLKILKKNKVITFDPQGNPKVTIIGPLVSQEGPGIILSLNPFAEKEKILNEVIQKLNKFPSFTFQRQDLSLERIKALELRKEGKSFADIASTLWPKQFKKEKKRIARKQNVYGEERASYEQFVERLILINEGKSKGQAYKEADRKFQLKGRTPINPLIVRAYRLLK